MISPSVSSQLFEIDRDERSWLQVFAVFVLRSHLSNVCEMHIIRSFPGRHSFLVLGDCVDASNKSVCFASAQIIPIGSAWGTAIEIAL